MDESKSSEIAFGPDDPSSQTELSSVFSKQEEVSWGDINDDNIGLLKSLNDALFPVRYQQKFYEDVIKLPKECAQFVILNGKIIGSVCCKLESGDQVNKLYIMTLGILAPFRGKGIGSKMLNKVLESPFIQSHGIQLVYLHVQTTNVDAMNFYKKHGFVNIGTIYNYYKRIDPPDCYILEKHLA